ncbi:tubulin tyrosine ligase 3-like isoform X2 [Styela clava]
MPDVTGLESVVEAVTEEEGNEGNMENRKQGERNEDGDTGMKIQVTKPTYDSSEFTFHPRVSSASSRIVSNLGMDFYERQQRHMERQKKLYEQQQASSNQEQPGSKRAKFAAIQKENQENMKPRPTTGEPSISLLTKRLNKRKPPHHVTYMESDTPRTPMPPCTSPPTLPPRSKTYFAMTSSMGKGGQRKRVMIDPYANVDRLQKAKLKAEKAIKNKKIFSIHGPYPLIRRALRERGWVEKEFKLPPRPAKSKDKGDSSDADDIDDDDDDDDDQKDSGVGMSPRPDSDEEGDDPDNKYGIMGRMVRNEIPTFQWTTRNSSIDWRFLQKDQVVNHYAKANFTTKTGLCVNLRTLTCFADAEVDNFFPRCYRLSQEEDKLDFIDDFRLVAATAILRIAVDRHTGEESGGRDPEKFGQKPPGASSHIVPSNVLQLAIQACRMFAQERDHEDIDLSEICCKMSDENWTLIIQHYYKLVHDGAIIENSGSYYKQCEQILEKLKDFNRQYHTDGLMNTWIVKPGAKSRGRGIIVMNRLEDILKLVQCDPTLMKDGRWVVQKYIERPLLVYGTKFDIRQWFLVTDWNPMTIWIYKTSYLRFSSKPFSLKILEPSVHLCNYSVQKNYEIDSKRHPMLPDDNMWSSDEFKNYMQSRGCEHLWDKLIFPGMRKAIIYMCQTAQDVVEFRKGSFELYGADFMVDELYNPWLIEINSSPTMARSTTVTSKMCASVQEDTLKVVLDRRKDRNCDIGLFELAYKQPLIDVPLYVGKSLQVEGFSIKKPGGMNGNGVRRSWGSGNTTGSIATVQRTQLTASQENKLLRTLSTHTSSTNITRTQQTRYTTKPPVPKMTSTRAPLERTGSPVKLKMQTTMKRLTNEVKSTPSKPNALNLPRFASNSSLHSNNGSQTSIPKVLSQGNIAKSVSTHGRGQSNPVGGFHCVSTTQAKAASTMGIIPGSHYAGLIAAANRGHVRGCPHQVIVPKTFPPSLVPGAEILHKAPYQGGVMAVTPQTIGLTLPLQKLFGGDISLNATTRARHMEIYNYPGQDFRFGGKQRVSGRLY